MQPSSSYHCVHSLSRNCFQKGNWIEIEFYIDAANRSGEGACPIIACSTKYGLDIDVSYCTSDNRKIYQHGNDGSLVGTQ